MSDRPSYAKERKKVVFDNNKLRLSAPTPGHTGKKASLSFALIGNNPRIIVYTNDPNDQGESRGYGKITANLDLPVFFGFLQLLEKVIAHEGEYRDKVENLNYIFPQGKRSEKPILVSELWVGKNKEGVVWISVVDRNKDRPRIQFPITFGEFHNFVHADGTPYSPAEESVLCARGWVVLLQSLMSFVATNEYVHPEPKPNQGGGGYRGGNSGGSGGGGGERRAPAPASDVDEDIPW